jgi:hypothetical protein
MLELEFHVLNEPTNKWREIYAIAQLDQTHPLWENYQEIDLDTYETMVLTTVNDLPASFQGIYNNGRWPLNVSRFCNRAYITPYFRELGCGLEITWRNVKYTLDQYDQWGKDVLFISRGVQYDNAQVSWQKFQKFCKFLIKNTGYNLTYDNRLYQCCPAVCKDCYQFCVWYDPKNLQNALNIHSISIEEWAELP